MKSRFFTIGGFCLFLTILVFSLGTPLFQANAQLAPACGYDGSDINTTYDSATEGCKLCHFFVLGNNILKFLLLPSVAPPGGLVPIIAVFMLVIGGFMFVISAGSPGSLEKGKTIMKDTLIALVVIYGAWLAVDFFFVAIGVADWTGLSEGWFIINCPT